MISMLMMAVETDEDREMVLYVVENYYALITYVVQQTVKNHNDVQDVVQDCILCIIEHLDMIEWSNAIKARGLITIIARNKAVDFCKKNNRQKRALNEYFKIEDVLEEVDDVADDVVSRDDVEIINQIIASMDDTYRDVCMLKYVYELKEREIATILDLSPKVVNQRIFRGKQLLRNAIKKEKLHE